MNRIITLAAALCLTLTVSACGQTASAGASASTPANASASASTSAATSASPQESVPETGREKQTTLSMEMEGQTEEVPATLYEGEGYSIYIPDEEWTPGEPGEWKAEANSDVKLKVEFFSGKTAEEARTAILAEYDQYGFMDADDDGHFTGTDGEASKTMGVWLMKSDGGTFALLGTYPDEAAEGFGARLPVIAGTFALTA